MIKKTLVFSSACHLSVKNKQLQVNLRDGEREHIIPLQDIGYIILENHSITLTIKLVEALNKNNVAIIFCDSKHMPAAMLQRFGGNSTYAESVYNQIAVSEPLKKQLWKKTVEQKIKNQALLLNKLNKAKYRSLDKLATTVKSGDKDNREGVAAKIYWQALFDDIDFKRERYGVPPNNLLNYGYAILRAAMARAISGSGLSPLFGIHHHNKYNPYALADDLMEPYRVFVDEKIYCLWQDGVAMLNPDAKRQIFDFLNVDTEMRQRTPLMLALTRTAASLVRTFTQKKNLIEYPVLV